MPRPFLLVIPHNRVSLPCPQAPPGPYLPSPPFRRSRTLYALLLLPSHNGGEGLYQLRVKAFSEKALNL